MNDAIVRFVLSESEMNVLRETARRSNVSVASLLRAFARHLARGGDLNFNPEIGYVPVGRPAHRNPRGKNRSRSLEAAA